jgi:hypothetical protein
MKGKRCLLALVLLGLVMMSKPAVGADCTDFISSLPYTITAQGIYCFTHSLDANITTGSAIIINSNNVTINLYGYKLGGQLGGPATQANGIYASNKKNIAIRNGTIRGFYRGILLQNDSPYTTGGPYVIEDLRADANTYVGIVMHGRGNTIRNVGVVNTGGSTVISDAWGIVSRGPGARIHNNNIFETKEQGTGLAGGILINTGDGTYLAYNVSGNTAPSTTGTSYGILIQDSANVIVRNNNVTMMTKGILFSALGAGASGIYMDNLASGCVDPFTGGYPAGTTNFSY